MGHWLMKSEPNTYSISDLRRDGRTTWEGVRNYQARNYMRDDVQLDDPVLFYHSSASPAGVAGIARVVRTAYPDPTAFDPASPYHDPKSKADAPRWMMVDVAFVEAFERLVPLAALKADPALEGMLVRKRGMRLSVQPVDPSHFDHVVAMGRREAESSPKNS